MKKIYLIALLTSCIYASTNTYDIKEQDMIQEIENKAPLLEEKMNAAKEKIKEKVLDISGEYLTKATISKDKLIDPTYTLDKDIPKYNKFGQQVGILYKKGYTFNPIALMNVIPPDFIVFNVCDNEERNYVTKLMKEYEDKQKDYMLVNSGCKNRDVKNTSFDSKVYYLTQEMKNKFDLEHTVSIVFIDKNINKIVVREVVVDEKINN